MRMPLRTVPALLAALVVAIPAAPAVAAPAPRGPRVVALATAEARPIEVAVSTKQVTLIHFDVGDVTMVAVGDPALVSVTVQGPDVLLRAQAFGGATNGFIWVAGRYTQWRFVVTDAPASRVIVVREQVPSPRPVTVTSAYRPPQRAHPPASAPAPSSPSQAPPEGERNTFERFLRSLSPRQLELFRAFLASPTLARLSALVQALNPAQQQLLLALLAGQVTQGGPPGQGTPQGPPPSAGARPPVPAPSAPAVPPAPSPERPPAPQPATPAAPQVPPVAGARVSVHAPEGVVMVVTPHRVGERLFVSYVLQNRGSTTLLLDSLRLRILDRRGERLAYTITRTSHDGYVGRLGPGSAEAGVITVEGAERAVVLEWTAVEVGTGQEVVLRAEVEVP